MTDTAAAKSGGTAPAFSKLLDDGAGSVGVYVQTFSDAAKDLHHVVQLPHSWAIGTIIKPHVHWLPTTDVTDTQTVVFDFEYAWINIGDVLPASTTHPAVTTYTSSGTTAAGTHVMTTLADISGTGKRASSIIICRIGRTAASTYGDSISWIGFDFHIQTDNPGGSLLVSGKP